MDSKPHIVIVEDDISQAKITARILQSEQYDVTLLYSGEQLEELLRKRNIDLILMDWVLPGKNGFETLELMRRSNVAVPVIFLTGNSDEHQIAKALDAGAEDYVVKPVRIAELLARIRKVIGRAGIGNSPAQAVEGFLRVVNGDLVSGNSRQHLTESERKLMSLFLNNQDVLLSRNDIAVSLWGTDTSSDSGRAVDVTVSRLRKKLSQVGGTHLKIRSRYGVGYVMEKATT
ncbi:response regulator transcription factor [Marinobacterium sp. AK62]|uniref:Response regulator transcription factor n=1 Tax=Marinobacterium alkalitolerans TaxID=1542925 RepID=A0ABS3Z727_9GAMM|nr:response regulator transcription factor [Marinobacterium alkalitolerans]MBP0047517.1 response regulator transcription factor [Marinobacterium alkalitolerans]